MYEVDQDGKVLHLKSLGKPESPKEEKDLEKTLLLSTPGHVVNSVLPAEGRTTPLDNKMAEDLLATNPAKGEAFSTSESKTQPKGNSWPEHFDTSLSAFLDEDKRAELKRIYLEGPEPPRVSDNGWAGRVASSKSEDVPSAAVEVPDTQIKRDNRRGRGGKHGGRGAGRSGHTDKREDTRKVLSEVSRIFRVFTLDLTPHENSPSHPRTLELPSIKLSGNYSVESSKLKLTRRLYFLTRVPVSS